MKFKEIIKGSRRLLFLLPLSIVALLGGFGVFAGELGGSRLFFPGMASIASDAFFEMVGAAPSGEMAGEVSLDEKSEGSSIPPEAIEETIPLPKPKISQTSGPSPCDFNSQLTSARDVIFSEISWMGSLAREGESGNAASAREWIELKNISEKNISLSGWSMQDADQKIKIYFGESDRISAGGIFLLERTRDETIPNILADKIYTGSLGNDGMHLRLFDSSCSARDEIFGFNGWPAGENKTKKTMERDLKTFEWHTSELSGGTPKR